MKIGDAAKAISIMAILVTSQATGIAATTSLQGSSFADPAFRSTWERTDLQVANKTVQRGYYWGPQPNSGPVMEDYAEGPAGKHLVQYFDKSRMEINDPKGDKSNPFFVTNGLLARELVTGRMQVGNSQFIERYPAEIPVAGDSNDANAPTYASFHARTIDQIERENTGAPVYRWIDRAGNLESTSGNFASHGVRNARFDPSGGHNIPDVFWDFLNSRGPVVVNGKQTTATLIDPWVYATGYAISGAYWARVKIAGVPNVDVLIQVFERRVLTYVPSAPEGFKVQMGNIGQHYYDWRYKGSGQSTARAGGCKEVVAPALAAFWAAQPQARERAGCPDRQGWRGAKIVQEPFEHGYMVDVIMDDTTQGFAKQIYVAFDDGTAEYVFDSRRDTDPDPAPTSAPQGLYVPVRGFGRVWSFKYIRDKLGWATAPESSDDNGVIQYFMFGRAIFAGPSSGKIFLFYNELTYDDTTIARNAEYDR